MKLIRISCCSALINPFYLMVEDSENKYSLSIRSLRLLASLLAGAIIAQALGCLITYLSMQDTQAAGMASQLLIEHLSYYFLGCAFLILSLCNLLVKRGVSQFKTIRLPSLILMFCVALTSFLIIPRMDYLQEIALQDGLPVMLSPFANYFAILITIMLLLLFVQILIGVLIVWRLSASNHPR